MTAAALLAGLATLGLGSAAHAQLIDRDGPMVTGKPAPARHPTIVRQTPAGFPGTAPTYGPFLPRTPSVVYSRTSYAGYISQVWAMNILGETAPSTAADIVWDDIPVPLTSTGATSLAVDRVTFFWGRLGTGTTPTSLMFAYATSIDLRTPNPAPTGPGTGNTGLVSPYDSPAIVPTPNPPNLFNQISATGNYGAGAPFTGGGIATRQSVFGVDGGATLFTVPLNISFNHFASPTTSVAVGQYGTFALGFQLRFDNAATPLAPANWTYARALLSNRGTLNSLTNLPTNGDFSEDWLFFYDKDAGTSPNTIGAEEADAFGADPTGNPLGNLMIEVHGMLITDPSPYACCINPLTGGTVCFTVGSQAQCLAAGGQDTGAGGLGGGSSCCPNPCVAVASACCTVTTGACQVLSSSDCAAAFGDYQLPGGNPVCCGTNVCAAHHTCCDVNTGICTLVYGLTSACDPNQQTTGTGTACGPAAGCPANGACCLPTSGTNDNVTCSIAVQNYCTSQNGNFTAGGSCTPTNICFPSDECQTTNLTAHIGATSGNSTGATTSVHLSVNICGPFIQSRGTKDVFLKFTAPIDADYHFDTCTSSINTVLSIHSGCPATDANILACNDDFGPTSTCSDGVTVPDTGDSVIDTFSLTNGTLVYLRLASFGDDGGSVPGMYTVNISFVNSVGACCDTVTGLCTVTDSTHCTGNGSFQQPALGLGACNPTPCVSAAGACCSTTGVCSSISQASCQTAGGNFLGGACSPNPCPQVACCSSGICALSVNGACAAGTFASPLTTCGVNPCPQFTCCLNGSCSLSVNGACTGGSTASTTVQTSCGTNPCPQPTGACCNGLGGCSPQTAANCTSPAGAFQGVGVACGPTNCGICCRGATCNASVFTSAGCTTTGSAAGHAYVTGACSGSHFTPCCEADYNKSGGQQTVSDIFNFLTDWFAHSLYAFPGGNGTTSQGPNSGAPAVAQIFNFLTDWFGPHCP